MQFGIILQMEAVHDRSPAEVFSDAWEISTQAERLGFDSVWFVEHHLSNRVLGDGVPLEHSLSPSAELMAARMSATTSRVGIGTGVVVLPFHHPILAAEAAAALDHMSGGRLIYGVGAGYRAYQFKALGIDYEARRPMMQEAIEIIEALWNASEPVSYDGKFWKFEDVLPLVRPIQEDVPIWIATNRGDEEIIRWAGSRGSNIMMSVWPTMEEVAQVHQLFSESRPNEGAGKAGEFGVVRVLYAADTKDDADADTKDALIRYFADQKKFQSDHAGDGFAIGTADDCIQTLRATEAAGVDFVMISPWFGGLEVEKVVSSMERIASQVLPEFR